MEPVTPRDAASRRHLVLVGLPGAGKTTVGRMLAAQTGRAFMDFDEEIERREGASVAQLFAERGEAWFREAERALTGELVGREGMVLAPGGGWITNPGLAAVLRPNVIVVYLKVRPDTALARMGADVSRRPLLAGDPVNRLRELFLGRSGLYEQADVVLDVEALVPQEVVDHLRAELSR